MNETDDDATSAATTAGRRGRDITPELAMLSAAIGVVAGLIGFLLAATSIFGGGFGAWETADPVTSTLIGVAMLGVAPGVVSIMGAAVWEEVRTLVWALLIVLGGMFVVSLVNAGDLYVATGGPLLEVLFSVAWLGFLGLTALVAAVLVAGQVRKPAEDPLPAGAQLPGWTKPAVALLGSGWLGVGAGLVVFPGYWAQFIPWEVTRLDGQVLGVFCLSFGIGALGALAEDDLARVGAAMRSVLVASLALAAALVVHAGDVDWGTGGAAALVALTGGMVVAGVVGRRIARHER